MGFVSLGDSLRLPAAVGWRPDSSAVSLGSQGGQVDGPPEAFAEWPAGAVGASEASLGRRTPRLPIARAGAMPPQVHGAKLMRQLRSTGFAAGWGCAGSASPPPPRRCPGPVSVSLSRIALRCPYWSSCFQPHLAPQPPSQSASPPRTPL